ncbi:hypothetical protein D3C78_1016990 [compost metagenome]
MAHQAALQLNVRHVIVVEIAQYIENTHRDTWHGPCQYLIDVATGEITPIFAYVKGRRVVRPLTLSTQDSLPRLRRIAIVIKQVRTPAAERRAKLGHTISHTGISADA